MYKNIFCIICLFLFLNVTFSQSKVNVDSLVRVYDQYKKEDTIKLDKLFDLINGLFKINTEKSFEYADEALKLSKKINEPYYKARSYFTKASVCISSGKNDDAILWLNKALPIFEKLKKIRDLGNVYEKFGAIQLSKRDFIKAKSYYDNAINYYIKCKASKEEYQTRSKIAYIYSQKGEFKKSIDLQDEIIRYFAKNKMLREMDAALVAKSDAHYMLGETSIAIDLLLKSLRINEELGELDSQTYLYQNLAVYLILIDPKKALEYAQKGLKLNEQVKNTEIENALKYISCGCYYELSDLKQAAKCFQEILKTYEALDMKAFVSDINYRLSNIYLRQNQYSNAFNSLQNLIKINEENQTLKSIPEHFSNLGDLIIDMPDSSLHNVHILPQNRYSESMFYLEKGLKMALEQNQLHAQKLIQKTISENYEAQKKYPEAYEAYKQYIILKDSISGDEVQKKITKSEIQYEYDKKELALKYEKQLTDKQLANQLLLNTQQKQSLTLKEQALELSQKEKELAHLAFLKEQAEKQDKVQQLTLAEEREKNKEQALNLSNLALSTQKKQNLYLALAISFLLIGLSLLAYFYQTLRKQKNIISQQNQLNEHTISILSHDIKEPLLGVKLLLKKLNVNDPILSQASSSLENQIHSVNGVLNNLLKMKKIALHNSPKDQKAHVNEVIQNVIKDLTFNLESKNLTIQNELKDLFTLPIAPEKLQIVVHNILTNAIKYSYPDQHIRIFQEGNGFCVQDYGIGIGKEQAMKLMTDVNTSHPGTQQEKGQGMGLFLIGILLQGEQVRVLFESPEVGGTIVKILA